ncbi:MAG: peptidase M28 [Alphaproteobacteria bacterium HGW-Alphaproteobacteria-16]|nr:MAG: peptidase M28 [Alphaproteobacteria bacterium HGW-Alphaproteobacteria-16]
MRFAFLAVLALAACNGGSSTPPEVAMPTMPMDLMKSAVQTLSSDEFEGRAPGTVGEEKTLAYLVDQFQKAGLQPGNNGSWFQDVPLVELTAQNVSDLSFTGGTAPIALKYGPDFVASSYRVTPSIAVKDSPVVFVGYGINAPERGWNDYAGLDVKGKTVVILVNDPDWETQGLDGDFGGRAMTYYGRWTYKYEEAARQGAAAALIVHQTEPAAYGWNVVQGSWSGPQQVADAANGHMDQTAANGWIQLDAARKLFASAGQDFDKLATAAKTKGFKPVALGDVKASLSFDTAIRKHASKNVIGILPGKTRPDEVVLYTAHWDHLGRCDAAPDGDDICNGAIDNATGTAALIAIAKANADAGAPDRSLVFLAVTAEESGLLGSAYYGANPVYPLAKTVGGVNIDAMNMTPPARNVVVVGKGKSGLESYLDRALAQQDRVATAEPTPEKGFYYRSDHFSLAKYGVPMLYFDAGDDLIEGGTEAGKAAAADYEQNKYHGPKDEYDPNWNWAGAEKDLQVYYAVGRMLAMTTEWPNWVEGDEFRAIRDKSRAGAK